MSMSSITSPSLSESVTVTVPLVAVIVLPSAVLTDELLSDTLPLFQFVCVLLKILIVDALLTLYLVPFTV